MGLEKSAIKCSLSSLRTPPTTTWLRRLSNEASTFHLIHSSGGAAHETVKDSSINDLRGGFRGGGFHCRQHGLLAISSAENGDWSFQPLINQPRRKRINSRRSFWDEALLQKTPVFLSFQINHKMMKKIAHQTFLKKGPYFLKRHCKKAALIWNGKIHWRPHMSSHQTHICQENSQWRKRWLTYSIYKWQNTHTTFDWGMIPMRANFSLILIFLNEQ